MTRGLEAVARGKDYERDLVESLKAIATRSKKLMAGAVKTHLRDFRECLFTCA